MAVIAKKRHLLGVTRDDFRAWCSEHELPGYRADQVYAWVFEKRATSFEQMSNLGKALRQGLAEHWVIHTSQIVQHQESKDGTIKLLLEWPDHATSECVLIPEATRQTACISSQVGCPVGCYFCASGLAGLQRQLTAGEIVEQAMRVRQLANCEFRISDCELENAVEVESPAKAGKLQLKVESKSEIGNRKSEMTPQGHRLSNVVFMGLGEPLGNYAAVVAAVRIINADWGMNIGARKITVSTVGLPAQIRKLAREDLQINLALSLHAPNDTLRRELIPWAEKISLDELIDSVRDYFDRTGREATLEYILLGGVNDRTRDADELVRVCRKMRCNVNLIRYNPVAGLGYERPTSEASQRFLNRLRERGVNAHMRRSRGIDIDAACGQLRRRAEEEGAAPALSSP